MGYLWNFKTFRNKWHLYPPEGPLTVLSMSDNMVAWFSNPLESSPVFITFITGVCASGPLYLRYLVFFASVSVLVFEGGSRVAQAGL